MVTKSNFKETQGPGKDSGINGNKDKVDGKPSKNRFKVLVLDDDSEIRDVLFDALPLIDVEPLLCITGEEAVDIFGKHYPEIDLCILDKDNKIGMGGEKTFFELKQIDPEVKAIMISGDPNLNKEAILEFLESGFIQVFTKPFNLSMFLDVVTSILNKK